MVDTKDLKKEDLEAAIKETKRSIEQYDEMVEAYQEQIAATEKRLKAEDKINELKQAMTVDDMLRPSFAFEKTEEYLEALKTKWQSTHDNFKNEADMHIGKLRSHIDSAKQQKLDEELNLETKEEQLEELQNE